MGKRVDSIPPETMSAFQWHSWPGNIRELQNMIERAVILSHNGMLHNPFHNRRTGPVVLSLHPPQIAPSSGTLKDSDPALILETLEEAGWVVGGPHGAAAKLGLKRTTLLAKMRRLGISRPITQEETEMVGMAPESICGENAQIWTGATKTLLQRSRTERRLRYLRQLTGRCWWVQNGLAQNPLQYLARTALGQISFWEFDAPWNFVIAKLLRRKPTLGITEFDFASFRMALPRYSMKETPVTLCVERCSVFVNLSIPKTEPIPEVP
jgi:hypothetical protein